MSRSHETGETQDLRTMFYDFAQKIIDSTPRDDIEIYQDEGAVAYGVEPATTYVAQVLPSSELLQQAGVSVGTQSIVDVMLIQTTEGAPVDASVVLRYRDSEHPAVQHEVCWSASEGQRPPIMFEQKSDMLGEKKRPRPKDLETIKFIVDARNSMSREVDVDEFVRLQRAMLG